jgi:superfamily II DNA or RNA helicase
MLFRIADLSATGFHEEKRLTLRQRCELASKLATHDSPVTVWCETNDESALLEKLIPDAREITGSMSPEKKEELILGFLDGSFRVLVAKPKLAGFGLNFQHCAHAVFASVSYSYEAFYQAQRRSHRFGQKQVVRNDVVIADTEKAIWDTVNVKAGKHAEMKRNMADAMKKAQTQGERMVAYDRPLDLWFPDWVKSEVTK